MTKPPGLDTQAIYQLMFKAIALRKIPPGTKLSEERLCKVFGVSRTRLREVFLRLSQDRIITQRMNRGAYVSEPTAQDTEEVFAARRAIESAIVEELARDCSREALQRLREHLQQETDARTQGNHDRLTQLTADFHVLLAELTGNSIYLDIVRRLVALSSLIIYLYDSPGARACKDDEHHALVQAIEDGKPEQARKLLLQHLQHVEESLRTNRDNPDDFDIEDVFTDLLR